MMVSRNSWHMNASSSVCQLVIGSFWALTCLENKPLPHVLLNICKMVVFRLYGLWSNLTLHLFLQTHDHMKIRLAQFAVVKYWLSTFFPVICKNERSACMLT